MRTRVWLAVGVGFFVLGIAALSLTLYLWVGSWPREMRETVDHFRSVAENAGRAPEPLIGNPRGRAAASLGGVWQAVIDPYGRGEIGGLAPRALQPVEPADHGEFSFEDGLTLEVPGDWNTQDPRLVFYQGVVWYKREFEFEPVAGRRSFLWIGAANYRAAIYLNGHLVGEHEGGFTPFNFEVTDALRAGSNLLVIRVDSRHGDDDIPTPTTDWLNYGGLTRDVFLVDVPATFVRNWKLQLAADGTETLRGWVELDGVSAPTAVELAIPELGVSETLLTDARGRAEIAIEASPELWSPERPRLYQVAWRCGGDRVDDEIGFRRVELDGDQLLLNGETIFLRGISIHEEAAHGVGRPRTQAQTREILDWAVDLGANFVRLSHYPHSEHAVRLADRMGLLVWEEIPVYWAIAWDRPATLERGRRQLSELIARDQNRASVIFWSVGNETPISDARQSFMKSLVDHVRASDDTRLTTAAMLTGGESLAPLLGLHFVPALFGWTRDVWPFRVDDPVAGLVDVPALNEYFGWYYSGAIGLLGPFSSAHARRTMLDNVHRIRLETPPGRALIVSEFGAGAVAGWHADPGSLTAYSEELQARVYREQLAMIEQQPHVVGISPWVLKDFRSPLRLYQGVQDYWNRKGLVADDGRRKLAFEVLRDWYRARQQAAPGG